PGTPVVWYGDEIGMGDDLSLPERNSVRTPMQWSAERNGGFSTVQDPSRLLRPVTEGAFGPQHVNATSLRRDPHSLLNWFERLIRRRRECPEIGFGTLTLLDTDAPSVLAHRCDWDGATIVAVHELAGKAVEVRLPVEDCEALIDLFSDAEHAPGDTLRLDGYGARWLRVRRDGQRLPP
ncbi:MAG TPA: hypothetical protein VGV67_02770, partial [Solirubrobacteraceae bacterium]|nr:hypothetical protein [Solirubrobacteraceae bacterium]